MQVPAPSGTRLYTLYASQPPALATGYNSWQAASGREVAFVHTLNLQNGWAVCVGLPKQLWGGKAAHEALAVSPNGANLYVVDVARGVIAVMDTSGLKVSRTSMIDLGSLARATGRVHAVVGADGAELYVARGSTIVTIDTATLHSSSSLSATEPVVGLGFGPRGTPLYLALAGAIEALNPSTGQQLGMISAPGLRAADYVVSLTP
jgi:hypothetical protein